MKVFLAPAELLVRKTVGAVGTTVVLLAALLSSACTTPDDLNYFVIGMWQHPQMLMSTDRELAINTLVSLPNDTNRSEWLADAASNDLKVIAEPGEDLQADAEDRNLVAWLHRDEPDLKSYSPMDLAQDKKLLREASASKPQMVNFSGSVLIQKQPAENGFHPTPSDYRAWAEGVELISQDIYPVAGWNSSNALDLRQTNPTWMAAAQRKLQELAGGSRRNLAFIEVCDQNLPWVREAPGPSPDQTRGQVWDAIINGATGIVYFSIGIDPFTWDNSNLEMKDEITRINWQILQLESYLLGKRERINSPIPFQRARFVNNQGKVKVVIINSSSSRAVLEGRAYDAFEVVVVDEDEAV